MGGILFGQKSFWDSLVTCSEAWAVSLLPFFTASRIFVVSAVPLVAWSISRVMFWLAVTLLFTRVAMFCMVSSIARSSQTMQEETRELQVSVKKFSLDEDAPVKMPELKG